MFQVHNPITLCSFREHPPPLVVWWHEPPPPPPKSGRNTIPTIPNARTWNPVVSIDIVLANLWGGGGGGGGRCYQTTSPSVGHYKFLVGFWEKNHCVDWSTIRRRVVEDRRPKKPNNRIRVEKRHSPIAHSGVRRRRLLEERLRQRLRQSAYHHHNHHHP